MMMFRDLEYSLLLYLHNLLFLLLSYNGYLFFVHFFHTHPWKRYP